MLPSSLLWMNTIMRWNKISSIVWGWWIGRSAQRPPTADVVSLVTTLMKYLLRNSSDTLTGFRLQPNHSRWSKSQSSAGRIAILLPHFHTQQQTDTEASIHFWWTVLINNPNLTSFCSACFLGWVEQNKNKDLKLSFPPQREQKMRATVWGENAEIKQPAKRKSEFRVTIRTASKWLGEGCQK